ncbi:glycine zipper 2TM domain-containing protein [Novosphingobium sp. ERW19]|uniref:glycine zipper 2TM domain-containing protein n=1 Tax=Novosphingobium sp. ERW19 TaxID=2726186 RepID=UPI0014577725|nr:glycine zipper 2TM domain-containing protein [Novosphingobium sp. ERW19]NLR39482.1 glycine zipper 2TM domain-containing protein [Novosphingobium sp. ERW19]
MLRRLLIAAVALGAVSSPALAGEHRRPGPVSGGWQGSYTGGYYGGATGPVYYPPMIGAPYPTVVMTQPVVDAPPPPPPPPPQGYYPQAYPQPDPRWAEMNERCAKVYGDKGVGGALLGGVVGGVAGNRIAGKGNRVLGTVAGAAVGAVAGNVIDKAEDKGLRRECDDYFASLPPQPYPGGPFPGAYPGYYPGYAPYGYVMVPVMLPPQKPCVEKTVVTETWVETRRARVIPRRPVRDKRVKEKRVYTG